MPYSAASSLSLIGALLIVAGASLGCGDGAGPEPLWPNEPAGFTVISDYSMSDVLPTGQSVLVDSGWNINNSNNYASRVQDATDPFSPPYVAQWTYPSGFQDGTEPATMYHNVGGVSEIYIAFWWKASNPWQDHPAGNKIAFQFAGGGGAGGQMFLIMMPGPTRQLRAVTEFSTDARNLDPNVTTTTITLAQWHRIELYMQKSTRIMKWWLDGVLQGSRTDINYPSQDFDEFQFAPTWGGNVGAVKSETDYFWYDHVHISRR